MSDLNKDIMTTERSDNKPKNPGISELSQSLIRNLTILSVNASTKSHEQSFKEEELKNELISLLSSQENTTPTWENVSLSQNSERFDFEQSKHQSSLCNDPMNFVSSEEIFDGAKLHANCPYDFQCKFGCFIEQKRYNCQCDIMCWFHGDCCYDFYSQCLGLRIDSEDSEILKAILRKLEFKSQVRNLYQAYRLLNLSSCLSTHVNQWNVLINKCGQSPEIKSQFKTLYEKISVANPLDFMLGLSMEDVKRRCEESSFNTDSFDNIPNYITLGHSKYNDFLIQYVNFFNKFCSFCNGIHPADVIDWHSTVICDNNKTFTLLDTDSYTEFIDAIHEFNCSIKHTSLTPIVTRYCFINESTYKAAGKLEFCDKSSSENSNGINRVDSEEICLGTRLCSRYSFRFTDSNTQQTYANPHCFSLLLSDTFESLGHINSSGNYCRFKINPCDVDIKFSFTDNIESFRQLFRLRTEDSDRKTIKSKTYSDSEAYISELNSCSLVNCSAGSIPVAGQCFAKHNVSEMLSRKHRIYDRFLPVEVSSIIHHHSNALVRLKVGFNRGTSYVDQENSHCQTFFQNRSFTDILLNENKLLQFWQSCLVNKEKIDLVSEFTQNLIYDLQFNSLQIKTIAYCQLISFGNFKCSEIDNIETGYVHNNESKWYGHENCGRNHSDVQIDRKEDESIDSCLLFELSSEKCLELKYKLLETYESLKCNIKFEPLRLLEITIEHIERRNNIDEAQGSPCSEGRLLQDVRLSISQSENHRDIVHINYDEIPEMDIRFLVTWSANLKADIDRIYPDSIVVSLCVKETSTLSCPSNSFVEFHYKDVIFEQNHLIISLNKTEVTDFLLDLDILIISADDIELEMKKHFGDNFFVILPKSEYVLLESSFLVCSSFFNFGENNFLNYKYTFVPSSTMEKFSTFFSSLLSITCLTLTILTYTILPVLRANVPGKIVFSLSLTLLISHLFFLLCLYPKNLACRIYAACHHAAWLSSFAWQSAMAFHLSHTLRNNNFEETRHSLYNLLAMLCWGVPLISVFAFFFLDVYEILNIGYGLDGICWIGNFRASLATFAIPVIVSVLFSLTCSFFVINAIRMSAAFRRSYASSYSNLKRQILLCVNLSLLMGFGWIFYFMTVPVDISFLWIPFLICHGSQGFFIFVCFIAKKNIFTLLYNKLCV